MEANFHARDISGTLIVGDGNDVNVVNHVVVFDHGSTAAPAAEGPPRVRRRPRPAQWARPPRAPVLLGRDAECARVRDRLAQGYAVQVHGPSGSGRTALLSRIAADHGTGTDAAVVFVAAAGRSAEDVLQLVFEACHDTEDYKPGAALLRRLMAPVEALVVVDDFEDPDPGALTALRNTLPGCDVLVSSARPGPAEPGAATRGCRLGGLSADASLALLARESGRPLSETEAREAARFAAEVHGHPRALVAAAALLEAGSGTAAFTADEDARAAGLAGRLGPAAARLLGALSAFQPLAVPTALFDAAGVGTPAPGTLTELHRLRLITHEHGGYRATTPLAVRTAEQAGTLRDAADAAPGLTDWLGRRPARHTVAAASGLVRRALADAARRGDDTAVRDLARAAAPMLARSLCWGTWQEVLTLGKVAATRLGATADVAYFAHEEDVRRRALGLAAVGAGLASAAGGLAVGQAINGTDPPPADGGTAAAGGSGAGLGGPLAAGLGVLVLGIAGLLAGLLASGDDGTPTARPSATATASGPAAAPVLPSTSEPTRPDPGKPSEQPTSPDPGQRVTPRPDTEPPDDTSRPASPPTVGEQPSFCLLTGHNSDGFTAIPVGSEDTRTTTYTASDCDSDAEVTLSVTPDTQPPSVTVEHQGCTPSGERELLCSILITFRPQVAGSYTSLLDVAHDGDTTGMTIYTEALPAEAPEEEADGTGG
ncbi:hypothetical protein AB0G32_27665 [Streptomyces sp. NPDC023723]|uniref:hypothetical protein n=1 Tax=Streptomyces sp. NPDC023723 TaxID=3154323 RepID=UPI0033DCCBF0